MKRKRNAILKAIALAVCLIMLVTFTPQTISAVTAASYGNDFEQIILEENGKPGEEPEYVLPGPDYPEIIAEKAADHVARLPFKEEMNTLVYMNDNGTETLYMFGMDVKYTDENGEIKDKSTKLALSEEGYYNPDNDIRVNFAKALENGVSVTYNDIVISVRPAELKESAKQAELRKIALPEEDERERVVYADAFEKADIVYTPTFDGFKEDIVVNEYNGVTEYVFTAFTENARIEGHDIFRGEERIGDIGAIYVLDSEGECTYGVLEVEEIGPGEYILTVSVDAEFLENAAYPVYIDPSITIYSYSSGPKLIEDAPVYSGSSSANGGNQYNYCGYIGSSLGYGRVLIKFPGLISNNSYSQTTTQDIISADFFLREASGKSGTASIYCDPFNESWNESSVSSGNVNINNYAHHPSYSVSCSESSSPKWWKYNITNTVKAWKNGTFNSGAYGVILINNNESSTTYYRNFLSTEYTASTYRPFLVFSYSACIDDFDLILPVGASYNLSTSNTYNSYTWFTSSSYIVGATPNTQNPNNCVLSASHPGSAAVTLINNNSNALVTTWAVLIVEPIQSGDYFISSAVYSNSPSVFDGAYLSPYHKSSASNVGYYLYKSFSLVDNDCDYISAFGIATLSTGYSRIINKNTNQYVTYLNDSIYQSTANSNGIGQQWLVTQTSDGKIVFVPKGNELKANRKWLTANGISTNAVIAGNSYNGLTEWLLEPATAYGGAGTYNVIDLNSSNINDHNYTEFNYAVGEDSPGSDGFDYQNISNNTTTTSLFPILRSRIEQTFLRTCRRVEYGELLRGGECLVAMRFGHQVKGMIDLARTLYIKQLYDGTWAWQHYRCDTENASTLNVNAPWAMPESNDSNYEPIYLYPNELLYDFYGVFYDSDIVFFAISVNNINNN